MQIVCDLHGEVDTGAFERAWQRLLERHAVLRAAFRDEPGSDEGWQQEVQRAVKIHFEVMDWRNIAPAERPPRLEAFARAERSRSFDLSAPPLMRLALLRLDEADYRLIWSVSQLVLDEHSAVVLLRESFALYETLKKGGRLDVKPSRSLQDYSEWLHHQDWSKAQEFWLGTLAGFANPTPLPGRSPSKDKSPTSEDHKEQEIQLSQVLTSTVRLLAQMNQFSLNTVVQGAWGLLLSRYSGEDDVVFGEVRAGRSSTIDGADSIVGPVANAVPIRVRIPPDKPLLAWLRELHEQSLARRELEHTPLENVQAWIGMPSEMRLFESIVAVRDSSWNTALCECNGHCHRFTINNRSHYPLCAHVCDGPALAVRISYDPQRFDDSAIARMLGHFKTVIEEFAAGPLERLSAVPLLTALERQQLLLEWNDTRTDFASDRCIHQLFEEQAERAPDAIALVFKDRQLTYRELNEQANELARRLQALDVGPEVLVGICVERSLEMVIALLAILKAGGAYVPLDPAYPKERLDFMLEDAQVAALVTTEKSSKGFSLPESRIIYLDRAQSPTASGSETELRSNRRSPMASPQSSNLAYVIYTSGSTGKPKGVMITHRNVANFFAGMDKVLGLQPGVWLAATSISFDISVLELFWTLTRGFKVVVQADEDKFRSAGPGKHKEGSNGDGYSLAEQIRRHGVTHFQCTPSLAGMLIQDSKALAALKSLSKLLLGGEALTPSLVEQLALPGEILNMYGPTETTVWSAADRVTPNESPIPIGRPIANTEIFILDKNLQPAPVGVAGELFIGGAGVARGYLKRPELTAERFIAHPFSSGPEARLYRTGDQARYRPDGRIEYLGRLDHQVKLRGFRIELGEIESALRQHPRVREGVVVVKEVKSGDQRLAAYLVPRESENAEATELRHFLKDKLPDFMVPSTFVWLDKLPLTPNGKVDRKALVRAEGHGLPGELRTARLADAPIAGGLAEGSAPLTEHDRHKILVEWNNTRTDYPRQRCLHELFEAQARKTPEAAAVICGEQALTYRELNGRANQLAHYLRKLSVGPEMWVGLCVDRSFELVIGLLGILKAGAAYLPLDWQYPADRLRFMLEDTRAEVLVTQERLVKQLPEHAARILCLDTAAGQLSRESMADPPNIARPDNLAYVMYTSGSTGRPKGAAIEHRAVNAFVHWARDVFSAQELTGVLASTSICFDLSVFELFVPLSWGGAVVLAANALELPRLPARQKVTLINTVPSAIRDLLKTGGVPESAQTVNLAGEPLPSRLVQQLYELPSVRKVYDLYGPSESTTYSTYVLRSPQGPVTVGRPIANTQVYILDERMQPVAVGAEGELFIGGEGLARGYLDRSELTAQKFIRNPFSAEAEGRLYRTGDLARYLPDGNIEFLGRIDHQVKIRGYRIELGEIESVLHNHPSVSECVAVAREDHPGEKMIAAYFVLEPGKSATIVEVRHYLRERLPDYMVPTALVRLDALPRTPNGKVDRRALPAPDQSSEVEAKQIIGASASPVEQVLAKIWCDVIGLPEVGRNDNFFDLGGHSVLVTQVLSRIRKTLSVELSLQSIFEAPTIAELAERVEEALMAEIEELSDDEAEQLLVRPELAAKEGQLK